MTFIRFTKTVYTFIIAYQKLVVQVEIDLMQLERTRTPLFTYA